MSIRHRNIRSGEMVVDHQKNHSVDTGSRGTLHNMITWDHSSIPSNYFQRRLDLTTVTMCGCCIKTQIDTTLKQHTDNLLSVNDTVKFMFVVQMAMYHYDMYVKVVYDNFNNKRRWRCWWWWCWWCWWWWWWWWWEQTEDCTVTSLLCQIWTLSLIDHSGPDQSVL